MSSGDGAGEIKKKVFWWNVIDTIDNFVCFDEVSSYSPKLLCGKVQFF